MRYQGLDNGKINRGRGGIVEAGGMNCGRVSRRHPTIEPSGGKTIGRRCALTRPASLAPCFGVAPEEEDEDFDFAEAPREIPVELEDLNAEAVQLAATIDHQEALRGSGGMTKQRQTSHPPVAVDGKVPAAYATVFAEIKERVRKDQYAALKSVNKQLVGLYGISGGSSSNVRPPRAGANPWSNGCPPTCGGNSPA